jgi:hypothetical protein
MRSMQVHFHPVGDPFGDHPFTTEQARIVQLLVERVDARENALEVRIRAEGLASLVGELKQQCERRRRVHASVRGRRVIRHIMPSETGGEPI